MGVEAVAARRVHGPLPAEVPVSGPGKRNGPAPGKSRAQTCLRRRLAGSMYVYAVYT